MGWPQSWEENEEKEMMIGEVCDSIGGGKRKGALLFSKQKEIKLRTMRVWRCMTRRRKKMTGGTPEVRSDKSSIFDIQTFESLNI